MTIQPSARPRPPLNLFESGFASPEEAVAHAERMIASRKRLEVPGYEPSLVRIIHGANEDVLPLGGQHVGRVRHELSGLFNIAPNASGNIGGRFVPENHLLRHGETLEFVVPLGRKGVGRVWTQGEFCSLFRMTEADFVAMVARGLPVHRMEDGSIRITETQVDEFLDDVAGRGARSVSAPSTLQHTGLTPLIAEVRRIADALDPPPPDLEATHPPSVESPYLNVEQAAVYLKKTPKALYGLIERRKLKKMPGSRVCYFTKNMLDDFLRGEAANGRGLRAGRRTKD